MNRLFDSINLFIGMVGNSVIYATTGMLVAVFVATTIIGMIALIALPILITTVIIQGVLP